jgi:hypothetical protein
MTHVDIIDADEQLLIFIPLKRMCKLHSIMVALPVGARKIIHV